MPWSCFLKHNWGDKCLIFYLLGFLCACYCSFPKLSVLKPIRWPICVLFCFFSLERVFLESVLSCSSWPGYSLNMLHPSHRHFQLVENVLCFAPTPFLSPLPCVGRCTRDVLESCVSKDIFFPIFPPNLEDIAGLPPASLLRGWYQPDPWSFTCDLFILSRSFHGLLFIPGFWKFHNNMPFVGWCFFFLSHQLNLTFANSCSSVPWNVLNYFFENHLFHIF